MMAATRLLHACYSLGFGFTILIFVFRLFRLLRDLYDLLPGQF